MLVIDAVGSSAAKFVKYQLRKVRASRTPHRESAGIAKRFGGLWVSGVNGDGGGQVLGGASSNRKSAAEK